MKILTVLLQNGCVSDRHPDFVGRLRVPLRVESVIIVTNKFCGCKNEYRIEAKVP